MQTQSHISASSILFESYYTTARKKEKRIYSDDEVAQLPNIPFTHDHAAEWKNRKESSRRLLRYLKNKNTPLQILEVGCGNGWLSHLLSKIKNAQVTGIDINKIEIMQAERVFSGGASLQFIYGDLNQLSQSLRFDIIIFASSIQYFQSLETTIGDMMNVLKPNGEIHILDTHFYSSKDLETARYRTQMYYRTIGVKELAAFYFHHADSLPVEFKVSYLYKPGTFKNKLLGNRNPFPWIRIQHS